MILDIETAARVEFVRVEYDVDEAMRGIRASDLPSDFAEFVRGGNRAPRRGSHQPGRHDRALVGATVPALSLGRAFAVEFGYSALLAFVIMAVAPSAHRLV